MRVFENGVVDHSRSHPAKLDLHIASDRPGLCRLGEALSELLASYPLSVETEALEPTAAWAVECFESAACELATV